ncbi:PD-(D/E)XK nuclease family protein [uncultured Prevotella sp.]|uniref:PD-(D/E)XK nuclease family protein n=1 Tax=uncultured Prevotella sp. TaxID=159272 RepID=UPI0027E325EE|nr:PD-(D/E)XK nuclease family protein [uncultured Prevotella sp.]
MNQTKTFLEFVSKDIIHKWGNDLSRVAVVFPNKRAALFMNEHLARYARKPMWSPAYITISDLFRRHSDMQVGDSIKLICDLHKSFVKCTGLNESLDHFYGWGQLLLTDFDDIDKNMADADRIFCNLKDIHELDDISYLDDEQRKMLKRFFANFSDDHESELKRRFLSLWSHFSDIYHDYNKRLQEQGLGYEGAIYREVATKDNIEFKYDRYIFVGFNLLQQVEQKLFARLKKMGKANFYWDFDEYYMPRHKTTSATDAGHYISMYLEHFPNELDTRSKEIYANMRQPKHISYISTATENIQARYVSQWLRNDNRYKDGRHTAVVMCDENILLPVMHSLPNEADKVNITSGFPLGMTPVASLISLLFDLYTTGAMQHGRRYRTQYVDKVLAHPYAQYIADCIPRSPMGKIDNITLLQQIGTLIKHVGVKAKDESDALFQESIFRMYTIINRLEQLAASGDMDVDVTTLRRLTKQLITTTTIPFHGEPVVGIQIMGVLETRNLDFNHVLLLSCNEGNMPKSVNDSSFIPYSIRKAHGLTTIDNKVAIYSYYFHRLLQRAQDVTIVYNNTTDNGHTGEMSRFMLQLMVDGTHNIKHLNLLAQNVPTTMCSKAIFKDEKIQQELDQMKNISPSAINVYIRCPLAFFYEYVARIKEPDCEDDTVDNRMFGNIFHKAAQFIYEDVTSRHATVEKTQLQKYLKDEKMLETVVDRAFNEELFKLSASEAANKKRATEYNGLQIINRKVIIEYLQQLLKIDQRLAPFTVLGLEKQVYNDIVFNTEDGAQRKVKIGGIIDRMDMVTNPTTGKPTIRVVDYKTGSPIKSVIKSIDEVFEGNSYKHSDYYLQTFLYSLIINNSSKLNPSKYNVSPALLFIKQASADNYDPVLCIDEHKVTDISIYQTEYLKLLKEKLGEIFSKQKPFVPTNNKRTCEMCAFRMICGI